MRLAVIHIAQETNDFNPELTTLRDYESFGLFEGAQIFEKLHGVGQIGGYLEAVEESGLDVESVPIIRGFATAGGRISTEAREFFEAKIRDGLAAAGRIDGLALQLHGACSAEGMDDVEGAQLELCRSILGPDVPIVLCLDHHANVTRKMVELSTAIVAHRTQPHDPFDTGKIGAQLLLRICTGEVRPVMAWRKLPLLSHQEQFLTSQAPMKTWFDQARGWEQQDPRVLHVANFPMQPWLDVAEGGWATVAVVDGDRELAERLADESAELAWSLREVFQKKEAVPVDVAVRMADEAEAGLVLLSDTGDTVFGGAAGDSNLILEAILRLGIKSTALVPMIAPKTVARLVEAGEGAVVTLPVGGQTTGFFEPLEVTGTVRRIGGGMVEVADHHQREVDMGRTVVFEVGPVTLLISELRGVAGNMPHVYRAFGIEPADYKMAILKTASNFQFFASLASRMIRVDTSGPGQSDVHGLPWKRLPRPIYPLDPVADWRGASS
ncbi:M81 family metallopeptidase [Geminicoccaceae bacterium 1502E]|nr:M81 family metallopeptidase [Geminicoccaceae bacterium 1502E]